MNEFDIVKSKLSNRRSWGAFLKTVDLPWLVELREKVNEAITEMEQAAKEQEKLESHRKEQIDQILQLIAESGLSLDDFIGTSTPAPIKNKNTYSPRSKAPAKYKFKGNDGSEKTWTGRGRMPVELADAIKNGNSLDDFLIIKSDSSGEGQ
ncbi:H-NS histone family protein [Aeromonas hydrophila]|uniref:H-NS histone family protein n=1 Tax=Aeromonas hydrophila TaxID=644 RepID=UPI003EC6E7FC